MEFRDLKTENVLKSAALVENGENRSKKSRAIDWTEEKKMFNNCKSVAHLWKKDRLTQSLKEFHRRLNFTRECFSINSF